MPQSAFRMLDTASDNIPIQKFKDTKFIDVDAEALAYFLEPPEGWAVIADCGNFPCTGPKNTFFSFERTTFEGGTPSYGSTPNF